MKDIEIYKKDLTETGGQLLFDKVFRGEADKEAYDFIIQLGRELDIQNCYFICEKSNLRKNFLILSDGFLKTIHKYGLNKFLNIRNDEDIINECFECAKNSVVEYDENTLNKIQNFIKDKNIIELTQNHDWYPIRSIINYVIPIMSPNNFK